MSVVALYLRISSEDADLKTADKAESESISNQRCMLSEYVRQHSEFDGWECVEFCDDGYSGKNFERPAIRELLEKIKQGKIDCLIVKDISRFSRDYIEAGNYISRIFPFLGVRFIAVGDGIDSSNQQDIDSLDTSFKTLIYDLYSRDLSRKIRSARKQKAENGDFLSPFAPYGYIKDPKNKNHLIPDADAAENIRRIFKLTIGGQTAMQIAALFNSEGIATPMRYKREAGCSRTIWPCINEDNFWTQHMVTKILRDERYIGKTVYGKRTRDSVGNWHTVRTGRDNWIISEDRHESIVSNDDFNIAQTLMREYREREVKYKSRLFQGRIFCGICGHAMTRNNKKDAGYFCQTPRYTDAYNCPKEIIPESDISNAILSSIRIYARYAVRMEQLILARSERLKQDRKRLQRQLGSLQSQSERYERDLQELYEKFVDGSMTRDEYVSRKRSLSEQADSVSNEIVKIEQLIDRQSSANNGSRFVDQYRNYTTVDELTSEMLNELLERVNVYPDGRLEIRLNYADEFDEITGNAGITDIS